MKLLNVSEQNQLQVISDLSWFNPFSRDYLLMQRSVLGATLEDTPETWDAEAVRDRDSTYLVALIAKVGPLAKELRQRLVDGADANEIDLSLYQDLVCYLCYFHHRSELTEAILNPKPRSRAAQLSRIWQSYEKELQHYLHVPNRHEFRDTDPALCFAGAYQIRRAFIHIFNFIAGTSNAIQKLRLEAWRSIFTHDLKSYFRGRYKRMNDIPTLITGPTGTGKELVARAIGFGRYIPFDSEQRVFAEDYTSSFQALNVSALPTTLIESELFGHKRGAYTDASHDRKGWFETCSQWGSVFLDEIGEIPAEIQVKLLRLLQTREFSRIGETKIRHFDGKVIAATNRNLDDEMRCGHFRQDLYYRLCADVISTPSLREQLDESPDSLRGLVLFVARRVAPDESQALANESFEWIDKHLDARYPWTGNVRELEQCVRSIWLRREYRAIHHTPAKEDLKSRLIQSLESITLTAEQLLQYYSTLAYAESGSYREAARRLDLDVRTLKSKVDTDLINDMTV